MNLEIDYDKLAEAIVKANNQVEEEANKSKKFTSGMFSMFVFALIGFAKMLAQPVDDDEFKIEDNEN